MFYFTLVLFLFISIGCGEKKDTSSQDDIKKKELELKEKELQLKEKEMIEKKSAMLDEKEKNLKQSTIEKNRLNLTGSYSGSIKDGTSWQIFINNFDGENFKGFDIVFWSTHPNGFKTNFTGSFNKSTNEIIIYEDSRAKGSGKFVGKVSDDGNSMSGDWFRYTDKGSFTWNLTRITGE